MIAMVDTTRTKTVSEVTTRLPTIVMVTDVRWDGRWMSRQYLADALSRHARVLLVEAPVSVASPLRRPDRIGQLWHHFRRPASNIAVLAPKAVPPQSSPRMKGLNARFVGREIEHALARCGWGLPDVVICGHARSWRLRRKFPNARFFAYLTDSIPTAQSTGSRSSGVQPDAELDERLQLLAVADGAIACSPPLVDEAAAAGVPCEYVPHGVDFDTIRKAANTPVPAEVGEIPGPRIGFIGGLTYRIDYDLVARIARQRPEWNFVFVGDKRTEWLDGDELGIEDIPNVHLLGARTQAELGSYTASFDVCWIPYLWNDFNRSSYPLKAMEYLAAGKPVVTNAFESMSSLDGLVHLVAEEADHLDALDTAIDNPDAASDEHSRLAFASENAWSARAKCVLDIVTASA